MFRSHGVMAKFTSVRTASAKAPREIVLKAMEDNPLPDTARKIISDVFLEGYNQATAARHAGVSRQRAHAVCKQFLPSLNSLIEDKKS